MLKVFCDKCGEEIAGEVTLTKPVVSTVRFSPDTEAHEAEPEPMTLVVGLEARDAHGSGPSKHLCASCAADELEALAVDIRSVGFRSASDILDRVVPRTVTEVLTGPEPVEP